MAGERLPAERRGGAAASTAEQTGMLPVSHAGFRKRVSPARATGSGLTLENSNARVR